VFTNNKFTSSSRGTPNKASLAADFWAIYDIFCP